MTKRSVVLLDPGSQRSFISESLVKRLRLEVDGSEPMITSTIGGAVSEVKRYDIHNVKLLSRFGSKLPVKLKCLSVPEITKGALPMVDRTYGLFPIADHVEPSNTNTVEILIGADYLPYVHLGYEKIIDGLVATKTIFGWVFFGKNDSANSNSAIAESLCALTTMQACRAVESTSSELNTNKSKLTSNSPSTKEDIDSL